MHVVHACPSAAQISRKEFLFDMDEDSDIDETTPSVGAALAELRSAVVTLARSNDEHARRISALESEVESCRLGAQAAAKGIIEVRDREQALGARLDELSQDLDTVHRDLGTKAGVSTLEALLKLKMDKAACENTVCRCFHGSGSCRSPRGRP